jgi:hypothetical protein
LLLVSPPGRQVPHFMPPRYHRWSQSLEVTFGEVIPAGEEAIKLWAQKREQGWQPCEPQWPTPAPLSPG